MSHLVKGQRKALYLALAALAAFLTAAPAAARGQGGNVIPHQATYQNLTYGQWQARWQQWGISIPATPSHPFFAGGNVLQAQTGSVWFLAGVDEFTPGDRENRSITIPSGIALFFPIVNVECSNLEPDPFHGDTPAAGAACATASSTTPPACSPRSTAERSRPSRGSAANRPISPSDRCPTRTFSSAPPTSA